MYRRQSFMILWIPRIEDEYYGVEHTAAMTSLMKQSLQKSVDYLQKRFGFSSDNYLASLAVT